MINVVCGVICKDGKILIARRKKGKSLEGYWEFPGGKIERDENAVNALKRELQEELGLNIDEPIYIGNNIHQYDTFSVNLMAYKCYTSDDPKKMTDHDKYLWVKATELNNFVLAKADIPIVGKILDCNI